MQHRPFKVALCGTHSSGKTSLALPLSEILALPFISERARTVAKSWNLTPATIPKHRLMEYQWAVIHEQVAAEMRHPNGFVSDRSTLDNLAYAIHVAKQCGIGPVEMDAYTFTAGQRIPYYDLLVVVPPMFPLVKDGERHEDEGFRQEIHQTVLDLVFEMAERFDIGLTERLLVLKSDGIGKRLDEIVDRLERTKEKVAYGRA